MKDLQKQSQEFPYEHAVKGFILLETIVIVIWHIYEGYREFSDSEDTYPYVTYGFLVLFYGVAFMFVGIQMTHRFKTHFIDEIYEEYGAILRRVTCMLSFMFIFAIFVLGSMATVTEHSKSAPF